MLASFYFEDGSPDYHGTAAADGYCCVSSWAGGDCGCNGTDDYYAGMAQAWTQEMADNLGISFGEAEARVARRSLLPVVTAPPRSCPDCEALPF